MRNENAEPKAELPEEQTETSNHAAHDKKKSLKSNETGNVDRPHGHPIMTLDSQSRHTKLQDAHLIDVSVQGTNFNESDTRKSCDSVYTEKYRRENSTKEDELIEKMEGKGNKPSSYKYGNTNVNCPTIESGLSAEREVSEEINPFFSQKLTEEPLIESRENETNYDCGKIALLGNLSHPSSYDGLIAVFFSALLRLSCFNEFLSVVNKGEFDEFIDALIVMGKKINMGDGCSIPQSFIEIVRRNLSKKNLWEPLLIYKQIEYFYLNFCDYFLDKTRFDEQIVRDFFFLKTDDKHGLTPLRTCVLSDENFVDHEASSVKKCKIYKGDSGIKLLVPSKIILFVPEEVGFSYQKVPFDDLLLNEKVYQPKSFILKTINSTSPEYFTCLLRCDNETWFVLNEQGDDQGSFEKGIFKDKMEVCGILYEN